MPETGGTYYDRQEVRDPDERESSIFNALPGLIRHVQCLAVPAAYVGGSPAYDGVAEMWWADTGGLDEAAQGFEELARRLEDSPADLAPTASLVGTELVVVWPENEGVQ